jgi:hypothetical protein
LAANTAEPLVLFKRPASAQVAVIPAAGGDRLSFKSPAIGHGIFTSMLMKALRREIGSATGPRALRVRFDVIKPVVVTQVSRLGSMQTTATRRSGEGLQTPTLTASRAREAAFTGQALRRAAQATTEGVQVISNIGAHYPRVGKHVVHR